MKLAIAFLALALAALAFGPAPALAKEKYAAGDVIAGTAVAMDGDTLRLFPEGRKPVDVRLWGIDAPEMSAENGDGWNARGMMDAILIRAGNVAACEVFDVDKYGRPVAVCRNDAGQDMGVAMIAGGWAVEYRKFTRTGKAGLPAPLVYNMAENEAITNRRGRWKRILAD